MDPELLLLRQTGWRVPVRALRYWVLGLPAPGPVKGRSLDRYGRLAKLSQSGWEIEFRDYQRSGSLELPVRIFVTNHRARVRLAIGHWELSDPKVADGHTHG